MPTKKLSEKEIVSEGDISIPLGRFIANLWVCITPSNTEVKKMITLRLNPKLEQAVNVTAKNLGFTKSELIRQCITSYINNFKQPNAWETGQELFGKYASGLGNLSANRKKIIKEKIGLKK